MKKDLLNNEIAEVELTYRRTIPVSQLPVIKGSKDAETIFRSIWSQHMAFKEEFWAMYLNRANRVLAVIKIGEGGYTGTIADPRLIFGGALTIAACGIIVAHNHPSGKLQPSDPDRSLTKNLVAGGKILEIQVLDHLILTDEGYMSFSDEGFM